MTSTCNIALFWLINSHYYSTFIFMQHVNLCSMSIYAACLIYAASQYEIIHFYVKCVKESLYTVTSTCNIALC